MYEEFNEYANELADESENELKHLEVKEKELRATLEEIRHEKERINNSLKQLRSYVSASHALQQNCPGCFKVGHVEVMRPVSSDTNDDNFECSVCGAFIIVSA